MAQNPQEQNIRAVLASVPFPATKGDILERVGNSSVTLDGQTRRLRDVLEPLPVDEFQDPDAVIMEMRDANLGQLGPVSGTELVELRSDLASLDFPTTKDRVLERVGDEGLSVHGRTRTVRDLLENAPRNEFEDLEDIVREIQTRLAAGR